MGFFMINALFVLIVFLLQLNKDNLHVNWPLGVKTNITYDSSSQEVIHKESADSHAFFVFFFMTSLQARIAKDLIELRNKSVFAFFMFNALFILIVFLLQLNKDNLHIDWPLGVKTNITQVEESGEVERKQSKISKTKKINKQNALFSSGLCYHTRVSVGLLTN